MMLVTTALMFFFSSRSRNARCSRDWSSDVCSSDLPYTSMGEAIANYLAAVGIKTRVRTMERAAFLTAWREKKLRGVFVGATGSAGNASTRIEPFADRKRGV